MINETGALFCEFVLRRNLAELGYVFDGSRLSAVKAEAFNLISGELNRLESEEIKKAGKRRGK